MGRLPIDTQAGPGASVHTLGLSGLQVVEPSKRLRPRALCTAFLGREHSPPAKKRGYPEDQEDDRRSGLRINQIATPGTDCDS